MLVEADRRVVLLSLTATNERRPLDLFLVLYRRTSLWCLLLFRAVDTASWTSTSWTNIAVGRGALICGTRRKQRIPDPAPPVKTRLLVACATGLPKSGNQRCFFLAGSLHAAQSHERCFGLMTACFCCGGPSTRKSVAMYLLRYLTSTVHIRQMYAADSRGHRLTFPQKVALSVKQQRTEKVGTIVPILFGHPPPQFCTYLAQSLGTHVHCI